MTTDKKYPEVQNDQGYLGAIASLIGAASIVGALSFAVIILAASDIVPKEVIYGVIWVPIVLLLMFAVCVRLVMLELRR